MATKKKLLQAAAGTAAAGGAGLNVEDVFSTYLYEGTGSTQTITNGIDLSGEGGLVWIKNRTYSQSHALFDTERGAGDILQSDLNLGEYTGGTDLSSFNSSGFTLGSSSFTAINSTSNNYASWTFRKAPKFFDVVTYTGTGSATTISHNLGSVPGCIIVKRTDSTENWKVYHRAIHPTNNGSGYVINLNLTNARAATTIWSSTEPTSTEFSISGSSTVNASGGTYVAYLFAHNDGDGDFGSTADQDIIKCGSYTGTGSSGNFVDLGFEPQWLMIKKTSGSESWFILDNMRGLTMGNDVALYANTSAADGSPYDNVDPNPTGFTLKDATYPNASGDTYIYIAIRRGPMAVPESATDVFDVHRTTDNASTTAAFNVGFVSDFVIHKETDATSVPYVFTRLLGGQHYLRTDGTNAEADSTVTLGYDWTLQNSVENNVDGGWPHIFYNWKRAPSFCDVVAYTGNGTSGHTISHNLGVAPEMIWVKNRDTTSSWSVNGSVGGLIYGTNKLTLHTASALFADTNEVTAVSATNFTLGDSFATNGSGDNIIAYLFASLDGVSKVFSVTKSSGSDASVNCGFSAGPRFVLLKRTDSTGDWYVWDSERGIVAGNDPYLLLNNTAAEVTSTDYIDPTSNGFTIVNGGLADGDYIGYAVA